MIWQEMSNIFPKEESTESLTARHWEDKFFCTIQKLRPYFQAHTIEVPTEYLMKQVLHKLETSGRLMKWAIELSEFDIRYKSKTAIKG